jgi:hypothetical protein
MILVQHDRYGKPILGKWRHYAELWPVNVARPALKGSSWRKLKESWSISIQRVTDVTEHALIKYPVYMPFVEIITPADFHAFCANELRSVSWTVIQMPLCGG